jgi:hypothetical protein
MTKQKLPKQPSVKDYEKSAEQRMKIKADPLGAKTKPVPLAKPLKRSKP